MLWPSDHSQCSRIATAHQLQSSVAIDQLDDQVSSGRMNPSKQILLLLAYLLCNSNVNGKPAMCEVQESELGLGAWTQWTNCSRTCGTGISTRIRNCLDGRCPSGRLLEYRSCCEQECKSMSADYEFKKEQCQRWPAAHAQWTLAQTETTDCTLDCVNDVDNSVLQILHVTDGTPCITRDTAQKGVCLGRLCTAIGCDGVLGSNATVDKCLRCLSMEHSSSACSAVRMSVSPTLTDNNTALVVDLPVGAISIKVSHRLLNGMLALSVPGQEAQLFYGRDQQIAGSLFTYKLSPEFEFVSARGPLMQPVSVQLVDVSEGASAVQYEYYTLTSSQSVVESNAGHSHQNSIELNATADYTWVHECYGGCSVSCGSGVQVSQPVCRDANYPERLIDEAFCLKKGMEKPAPLIRKCAPEACPSRWVTGEWSGCQNSCDPGTEYRSVVCQSPNNEQEPSLDDRECSHLIKPNSSRPCPIDCVVHWSIEPWSLCTGRCDESQSRTVECRQLVDGVTVADKHCSNHGRPVHSRGCDCKRECEWRHAYWRKCSNPCGFGEQSRVLRCRNTTNNHRVNESCCSGQERPSPFTRQCFDHRRQKCVPKWHIGEKGPCEGPCCGRQYRQIQVTCVAHFKNVWVEFPDSVCDHLPDKPSTVEMCTRDDCVYWSLSKYGPCSRTCAPAFKTRTKTCLLNGSIVAEALCVRCHGDKPTRRICGPFLPCPPTTEEPTEPILCIDTHPTLCEDVPQPCGQVHIHHCCATCNLVS